MLSLAEKREIKRYRKELEEMENAWANDDFTEEQDYEFRKFGFDDQMYNRLYKKHQRNMRRIQRRNDRSKVTLWDFIDVQKK